MWPAAARKRLSGEMQRRFTWESECWIVREQMPERASQNLRSVLVLVCTVLAVGRGPAVESKYLMVWS